MRRVSHDEDETDLATLDHFSEDFGDEPIFKCKNCASKNPGYEEKEASLLTIIAAVVSLIIFRLYSFLILPLVIESTKTIIKKCVKCDHVLDKQELLSMPSLTDKILSFKCGNCAMVISRKYALVLIAILSIIWFFIPSSDTTVNPGGLTLDTVRWEDFVEDCGRKVVLNNQVRAKRNFAQKYAKNVVEWKGVVHSLLPREKIKDPFIRDVILVKMNPSDSKEEFPDIQLVFSNNVGAKNAETIRILQPGDVIEYKAVLRTMGDEFHYHDFEALGITFTGQKTDLASIPMISYTGAISNLRKGQTSETDSSVGNDQGTTSPVENKAENTQSTEEKRETEVKKDEQQNVQTTSDDKSSASPQDNDIVSKTEERKEETASQQTTQDVDDTGSQAIEQGDNDDGTPADGTPVDGTPVDGTPVDGTPVDGTPVDGNVDGNGGDA